MATFIPPYLGDEVKSDAEKKVFKYLHHLDLPNAYVLHSLGLPRHKNKIYGEIDFVIICEYGVACLEIKGGRVSCHNGLWTFCDRDGNEKTKAEGPFEQVISGMFSLRERLQSHFVNRFNLKNVNFAAGVMFTDIEFNTLGQSIIPEIIFDLRFSESDISVYIRKIFDYWRERNPRFKNNKETALTKKQIETIRNFLRGDFGFVPSLKETIDTIDSRLLRLTEDQYNILDSLSQNDRFLITGVAGTGKTLLAVEFGRRQVEAGNRTLLLVYNKNLSAYLKHHSNDMLRIEHFHGLIADYLAVNAESHKYFEKELPEQFYRRLRSGGIIKYDVIIIDEGQDLLKPSFLMCIDELVKGGLEEGKWSLFYDPNQNIYNEEMDDGLEYLKNISVTKWTLPYNCRNTKPIGLTNAYITHFPPAKHLKVDGDNPEYVQYESQKGFSKKLRATIEKFINNSFNLNEITLLSPVSFEKSIIYSSKALDSVCEVSGVNSSCDESIVFSTIQGFKGLESKVVILTDIDKIKEEAFEKLLYTAISRAKVKLFFFCTPETKKILDERFIAGVKKMGGH